MLLFNCTIFEKFELDINDKSKKLDVQLKFQSKIVKKDKNEYDENFLD